MRAIIPGLRRREKRSRQAWRYQPRLDALEDRTLLDAKFSALADQLDARLDTLQTALGTVARTNTPLPILNAPIQSLAAQTNQALDEFQKQLKPILKSLNSGAAQDALRAVLYSKLDQSGFVRDLDGNGTNNDRVLTKDLATGVIQITMNVGHDVVNKTLRFGVGLPGLPMDVSGGLNVNAGFAYNRLTIRLNPDGSTSFDSPVDEIQATVNAGFTKGTSISGRLGFLNVKAKDAGTKLTMALSAPVQGTGLGTGQLTGQAVVNLDLATSFLSSTGTEQNFAYPGVTSNLYVDWKFANANPLAGLASFGSDPTVEFRNVTFQAGRFLSNVLRPIIDTVQQITEPLRPILSIVDKEIPGLTDVGKKAGFGPVTLFTLAKFASATGGVPPDYKALFDLALTLHQFRTAIDDVDTSKPIAIPIGSYSLAGSNIRDKVAAGLDSRNLTDLVPVAIGAIKSIRAKIDEVAPEAVKKLFSLTDFDRKLKGLENGGGLSYPLFDDPKGGVFKLLLGQDVDFVNFTGRFHFDAYRTELFHLWGPVFARLNGEIDVDAYVKFGYDTYGLRRFLQTGFDGKQLANGLYFDAREDLIRMNGSISAGVALSIPLDFLAIPIPIAPGITIPTPIRPVFSVNGTLAAEDVRVRFNSTEERYRPFEKRPEPLLLTQGRITSQFTFVVEVGIPGVLMIDLYRAPLGPKETHLDLYNGPDAHPANPFNVPPTTPPPKKQLGLDLNQPLPFDGRRVGNDGLPDRIRVYVSNKHLFVYVSDGVTDQLALSPTPLVSVLSLSIIGSDDDEILTVKASVNLPIKFTGSGGENSVELLDADVGNNVPPFGSNYVVATNKLTRTANYRLFGIGLTQKVVTVDFTNVKDVRLDTSNVSPNQVIVGTLNNQKLDLNLGQLSNFVSIDTTDGGTADVINIHGNKGVDTVLIADTSKPTDAFTESGATYTVASTRLVRTKRTLALAPVGAPRDSLFLYPYSEHSTTTINYDRLDALEIKGGDLGNDFNVQSTAAGASYLLRGGNNPSIGGNDVFTLGAEYQRLGFLRHTQLRIDGGDGLYDQLILDDSMNDGAGKYSPQTSYDVNSTTANFHTTIGFFTTFDPFYFEVKVDGNVSDVDIESLTIKAGNSNTFNVYDTLSATRFTDVGGLPVPLEIGQTTIHGGAGDDQVNVYGSRGHLNVDGHGGTNAYVVGAGTVGLDNVGGNVYFTGAEGVNSLLVTDQRSQKLNGGNSYDVAGDNLYRLGKKPVFYQGLTTLKLFTSNGQDLVTVNDTIPGNTVIFTANEDDAVVVNQTSGPLTIDMGAGGFQSVTIGDATHPLDAIRGRVDISGAGAINAYVSNAASSVSQSTWIDTKGDDIGFYQEVKRQQLNGDVYDLLNVITFRAGLPSRLNYTAGQAGDVTFVSGSPANVTTSLFGGTAAAEYFWIQTDWVPLLGPVFVDGGPANNDNAFFYDYSSTTPQTYRLFTDPTAPNDLIVERTATALVTYRGIGQLIFYAPYVGGNAVNVQGLPAAVFLNAVAGPRDVFTLGSNAPGQGGTVANLLGTISVAGSNQVSVILDDSGGATPRQVAVNTKQDAYGDFVTGLAGGRIYVRLDDTSSVTILGGQGDDTFAVNGTTFGPAVRIDAGGGLNTLDYAKTVNVPSLVSWYKGEVNYHDGFGGNHGSVYSTASFTAGKVGYAFSFDASQDQYVQVPNVLALEPTTVAVEAWVNATQVTRNAYIVAKGASNVSAASYTLYTGDQSGLQFYVYDGAGYAMSPAVGAQIWDGQWHHVVGTFDGATVRLYVDGVEVGQGTTTNVQIAYNLPTSNDLIIGNYFGAGRRPFNGLIDEVAVYSGALSAQEVQRHYAAGAAGLTGAADGVHVNLTLGTASGLRGGIDKIHNVIGSAYNDILVGSGGNVLTGNAGRDLLIAGAFASTLNGGDSQDILIGGTTVYDHDRTQLDAVLAEWSRNDLYGTRVNNLRNGLLANGKVLSNGQPDTLGGQADLDLFFGSLANDSAPTESGEVFVDV